MGLTPWVRRDRPRRPEAQPAPEPVEGFPQGSPVASEPTEGVVAAASTNGVDDVAVSSEAAREIAGMEWPELEAAVRDCRRCPLHESRTQSVFGVGNRRAELLIIGEAPGAEEDRRGEPFVGRAGGLLDIMLSAIGLDRDTVYITNILKSRPPENRDPRAEEVAACEPYLQRQIELIEPAAILAVGRVAAQNLLGTSQALGKLRGCWHRYGPRATPLRVSYHPAYLLRRPADKRKAWQDLKLVRDAIGV